MLLPCPSATTQLLAASTVYAPGAVAAPAWVLPVAGACTTLIPAGLLTVLKGIETDKKNWETKAHEEAEGFAVSHPDAFCVLESGAKGMGLFATQFVPKGSYLFDYTGELLSQAQYDRRYPNRISDYCAAMRNPATGEMHFVDGIDEVLGHPSRWMNHDDRRPNVGRRSFFPTEPGAKPRILMYALRDLNVGDELQWSYGEGYWQAHQDMGMTKIETE